MKMLRIYISYSPEMSVVYCFWKYFFQTCGIWMTTRKIGNGWKVDNDKLPHLFILSKKDEEKIKSKRQEKVIYCVESAYRNGIARDDIIQVQWENAAYYKNVIFGLFSEVNEKVYLYALLQIWNGSDSGWKLKPGAVFKQGKDEGLWGYLWLFHEIAVTGQKWNEEIEKKCANALEILEEKEGKIRDNWNYKFFKLYCEYVKYGICDSLAYRIANGKKLLKKCEDFADENGWMPTLCVLAGRICTHNPTENKYAVSYYKSAVAYEEQPSLFYDIGHVYEKAFRNEKKAMIYYREAYRLDKRYYPALYKIIISYENEEKWLEAIMGYGEIRNIINYERVQDSISVKEIEYDYKSCRRMIKLYQEYVNNDEFANKYKRKVRNMNTNLEDYVDYHKLMHTMFWEENAEKKRIQLMNELKKRLNTECCK